MHLAKESVRAYLPVETLSYTVPPFPWIAVSPSNPHKGHKGEVMKKEERT
jgi:hypothetical protein